MDLRDNPTLRIISIIVLAFFLWTFGGLFDIAYAIKSSDQQSAVSPQKKAERPEEKFQKTIEEIEQAVTDTVTDTDTKKNKLRSKKSEVESLDLEIKKQFAETEKKLKDSKLPDEILQRHYKFVRHYEENLKELKANLDEIQKHRAESIEFKNAIEKTKAFLEKVKPPKKHIPLDPNKLPHRTAEPVWKEPRLNYSEQVSGVSDQGIKDSGQFSVVSFQKKTNNQKLKTNNQQILVASNGSLEGLLDSDSTLNATSYPLYAQASNLPTDADLAETIEVQFTPEIKAKASELNYSPVKIYNWVRNNIEFVPTYGSIQGANMCLQTKQCNDFDTASLLIALLRVSGIHAKYVYGTIELPIEKVMNWVGGFTDANSALTLIASGGIPVTGLTEGGVVKYVQMEHVWVEAYVGYGPYSGRPSKLDPPKTWIPLDSSFKQYTYTEGINLQAAIPFDAQSFLNQIKSTATINETESYVTNVDSSYIQTTLTDYQTQLQNYINQNMPNATVGDILGKKEIKKQELGILPATLPYKKIVTGAKYSEIPDNLRHKVTFTITDPYLFEISLSYTGSIPKLAGKRITLSYTPATSADQQIIDSYGGIYNVPAYLVSMKPQIKVEGVVKATGSSIGLGNQQTFDMAFSGSGVKTDVVSNNVTTGAYYGIGLNPYKIPKELIEQRKAKLESVKDTINQSNIYTDDYIGELLYTTAIVYFFELDVFEDIFAQSYKVAKTKQVSEGIVAKDLSVSYLFSIPMNAEEGGLIIDVDRNIYSPVSKSGDKTKSQEFMIASGQIGSGMEQGIFEQMYNKTGTSAVKALSVANEQGIPIYAIDRNNINNILPILQVSGEVKTDIQNAVNAGKVVSVSKAEVTVDTWTGVGYIILDQNTGAGAYMISGGFAGGGSDVTNNDILSSWERISLIIAGILTVVGALIYGINWTVVLLALATLMKVLVFAPLGLVGAVVLYLVMVIVLVILVIYLLYLIYQAVIFENERYALMSSTGNAYMRSNAYDKRYTGFN